VGRGGRSAGGAHLGGAKAAGGERTMTHAGGASAGGGAASGQTSVSGGIPGRGGAGSEPIPGGGQETFAGSSGAGTVGGGGSSSSAGDGPGGASNPGGGAAGQAGAGGADAGDCVEFVLPEDCAHDGATPLPPELRCTGLYGDWEHRKLACGVRAYTPAYELWSDGARKQRFVSLPPGAQVDVSDPDNWVFPVGTRFWKEFWVGADPKRLGETRLLRKTAQGWLYTSYVWSDDGKRAVQVNDGVADLFGSGHTVPKRDQCRECHSGRPDFVLGWDAVMLGLGASPALDELASEGLLSGALNSPTLPFDDVERAALTYLHANCGVSCHNSTDEAPGRSSGLYLRIELSALASAQTTAAVTSGMNREPDSNVALPPGGPYYDLRPLDPARSLIVARMSRRDEFAMPRIGSNFVDERGVSLIRAWIEHMTPERGYPAPAP